jgi:glycosyl hydrolase family 9
MRRAAAPAAGLKGCAPEKCYADNIEAWSVNEEAINWNAPLAWVAAFFDEKGDGRPRPARPRMATLRRKRRSAARRLGAAVRKPTGRT